MLVLLKLEKDFAHARFKKSFSSQSLRLRVGPLGQNVPRFGFIVPKKILPHVVDRNKVKRRLKSIILKHLPQIKPFDVLIFPQRLSLNKTFLELEAELINDFKRLNLWKS